MRFHVGIALTSIFLIASLTSAQEDKTNKPKKISDYSALAKAPDKARSRPNPLENDPSSISAGANLFEQHCAECHGEKAEGRRKGPSLRVEQVQDAPPGAIFWIVTNGVVRRGMPVWSKLPEPQRWQIITYLKSLGIDRSDGATVPTESRGVPKS